MSLRKISFFILSVILAFTSCNDDDQFRRPEPFDFEQNEIDNSTAIVNYLKTHYYNSSALETNPSLNKIAITKLDSLATVPPAGSTLLMDKVEVDSLELNNLTYKYYTLKISQGKGVNSPTFSDNILIAYEGRNLLSNSVFDSRLNPNPAQLDLTSLITGWQLILPQFNAAESAVNNGDGTIGYNNPGVGVMFLPAGLGYLYSQANNNLDVVPLIFKFEVLRTFENDHDSDGIPSYLEDVSGNQFFRISEDDTDADGLVDYLDNDDDNDGIPTQEEITITTENRTSPEILRMLPLESNQILLNEIKEEEDGTFTGTVITFIDTDGDAIPDYLDVE